MKPVPPSPMGERDDPVDKYDLVWCSPSTDQNGSMPIGNGEMGLNVWVEPTGDLMILVGRTASWDENERLCKVGRVRIKCTPSLVFGEFRQTLRLRQGEIEITGGPVDTPITVRVWPDANHQVAWVEAESVRQFQLELPLEIWRDKERTFLEERDSGVDECHGVQGFEGPKTSYPDAVLSGQHDRIVWYHRNPVSPWKSTLERQQLSAAVEIGTDPLLHRTFGGLIQGHGLVRVDDKTMKTAAPGHRHQVTIHTHTRCRPWTATERRC